MAGRFEGTSCVLCPAPSLGVGEHVWPAWLIREFHGEGPFYSEKSGEPYKKRDQVTVATQVALPGVHVPMCGPCNTRLNSLVEVPAKPVVRKLLPKSSADEWPTLTESEAAALGRWFLKVGLLLSHPEAVHDNPKVAADSVSRHSDFRTAWTAWMTAGSDPPGDFSVFVTRRDPRGEGTWTGERTHVSLPAAVVVDGEELRFMTRSLGIRGLNATIVWHPGWPIVHTLVEEGRAAVLWPDPSVVDLSVLPEVHPREFSFVAESGRLTCSQSDFDLVVNVPLQVGVFPPLVALQVGAYGVVSDA